MPSHEVRPLLAARGFAVPGQPGLRLHTLADVFAYAAACGIELRLDGGQLVLVYTPTYDPDANRIEWLWGVLRRTVTHTHQRTALAELLADAQAWAHTITRAQVLSQIGSPFALDHRPAIVEELNHAA